MGKYIGEIVERINSFVPEGEKKMQASDFSEANLYDHEERLILRLLDKQESLSLDNLDAFITEMGDILQANRVLMDMVREEAERRGVRQGFEVEFMDSMDPTIKELQEFQGEYIAGKVKTLEDFTGPLDLKEEVAEPDLSVSEVPSQEVIAEAGQDQALMAQLRAFLFELEPEEVQVNNIVAQERALDVFKLYLANVPEGSEPSADGFGAFIEEEYYNNLIEGFVDLGIKSGLNVDMQDRDELIKGIKKDLTKEDIVAFDMFLQANEGKEDLTMEDFLIFCDKLDKKAQAKADIDAMMNREMAASDKDSKSGTKGKKEESEQDIPTMIEGAFKAFESEARSFAQQIKHGPVKENDENKSPKDKILEKGKDKKGGGKEPPGGISR